VFHALAKLGIQPTYVAGTSAGAIVGSMYADGLSVAEMMAFWEKEHLFDLGSISLNGLGLFDMKKAGKSLEDYLQARQFSELKYRLFVVATQMISGQAVVFEKGELIPAICASAAFPLMFSPVVIEESIYLDGGILNNFPTEPLREICDVLIGVNVSPLRKIVADDMNSSTEVMLRTVELSTDVATRAKLKDCDVVISPESLSNFPTFNQQKIGEIFKIGFDAAMEQEEALRKLIGD
ncbi:MAG: patatin-like phospholipase family protein, partial [Bacteroidota bacterium]